MVENKETFQLIFKENFLYKGFILSSKSINNKTHRLKVISDPVKINGKWYHKLINFITFGLLLKESYSYKVEVNDV